LPGGGKIDTMVVILGVPGHSLWGTLQLSEKNKNERVRALVMLVALIGFVSVAIATPLQALAQGVAPVPESLPPTTTAAPVSVILLVVGLAAVGMVAVKVTGLPAPGARSKAVSVPDEDELVQDE